MKLASLMSLFPKMEKKKPEISIENANCQVHCVPIDISFNKLAHYTHLF